MEIHVIKEGALEKWEHPVPGGFFHGYGVFETFKSVKGRIFRLNDHLARMEHGARHLGLFMPGREEINWSLTAAVDTDSPLYLKLVLVLDEDTESQLFLLRKPLNEMPRNLQEFGITAVIASFHRNPASPLVSVKSLSYLENLLARRSAQKRGAYEGLFLNTEGHLTEGAHSNLFWIKDGKVIIPSDGFLPGITREAIIEICRAEGIPIEEGAYGGEALYKADEAFISSSIVDILPLIKVDDHLIGTGKPGELTRRLMASLTEKIDKESKSPGEPLE